MSKSYSSNRKIIIVSIIVIFMVISLCFLKGIPSKAESLGGYQIDSYDCYYRVTEDNTYHVIETIKVTFLEPRHGIYRQIPEVNQIERLDGSQDTVIAQIDVTSCSDEYSDYRDGSDRVIKLGDSDVTLTGQHTYTICYDVKWGPDRVEGEDEFYMNLIGDGWDVDVNNLTEACAAEGVVINSGEFNGMNNRDAIQNALCRHHKLAEGLIVDDLVDG